MTHEPAQRRGRGRPPGSRNKPKIAKPVLSPEERDAIAAQIAMDLREAITTRALASERIRGLKGVARMRLGLPALRQIEASVEMGALSHGRAVVEHA